MKHSSRYRTLKWSAFFLTVILLSIGFVSVYLLNKAEPPAPLAPNNTLPTQNKSGELSNEEFASLIEENLSELGFIKDITFKGSEEGTFTITGTISNPDRLITLCKELKPYALILNAFKGTEVSIHGHLGADENGNGQFISDTITCAGLNSPAGIATTYIEEYTGLNDLFEVPIEEISITQDGISFSSALPTFIQTALYK